MKAIMKRVLAPATVAGARQVVGARRYRAVVCTELLPPPPFKAGALRVKDLPSITPKKGEVVLDVKAAAVNFPDLLIVQGKYQFKPEGEFSPGSEVAGVVKAVGEGVKGLSIGDHAIASLPYGGYAQECAVPHQRVIPIPKSVPFPEAASVLMAYGTSHYALVDRAQLKAGETVLVLGAAGGVGLAAVQLAKALGARVIAACSDENKLAVCKASGADVVINYGTNGTDLKTALKEVCPEGVEVVYDPVGGKYSEVALRSMAWKGRFLVVGFAAGDIPQIPLNLALLKGCSIVGVSKPSTLNPKPLSLALLKRCSIVGVCLCVSVCVSVSISVALLNGPRMRTGKDGVRAFFSSQERTVLSLCVCRRVLGSVYESTLYRDFI
jgi:NADPH2:quinone reductase